MFINLFNYIMFIIIVNMSCNIIRYITCIEVPFRIVIGISIIQGIITFSYIVCIISVNGIMLINNNIIIKIIICLLYIMRFYLFYSYWKHQLNIG